jgi:hypothetical protein
MEVLTKKQLFPFRETAKQLRSQRPLHVQGDAGQVNRVLDLKRIIKNGGPKRKRGTRGAK